MQRSIAAAATVLASAALAAPTDSQETPFFSIVREGPGSEKVLAIENPSESKIDLSRLAIGRKFSNSQPELIINLEDEDIKDVLYNDPIDGNDIRAKGSAIFCDISGQESWWGAYDRCDYHYKALTNFNGDDVLKLYLDGVVVDVVGDEYNKGGKLKVNDVCGIRAATSGLTLVRKASVTTGNPNPLASFGTTADDCEWIVTQESSWSLIRAYGLENGLPHPIFEDRPFFSLVTEGPGSRKALGIKNPSGSAIDLSRLSVGRKFSDSERELIINLGDEGIKEPLYNSHLYEDVLDAKRSALFCDISGQQSWWGGYDTCDYYYEALTNFNGDDTLKLYVDGYLVDIFGDESNLKVNDVCGTSAATSDRTLVRKESVTTGNPNPLASFGTTEDDCEWRFDSSKFGH